MKRKTDSSWVNLLENRVEQRLLLKRMMSITLFGSYSSSVSTALLRELKAGLIENGYQNTRLVSDFPNEGLKIVDKIKIIMDVSDVNFFIFTQDGRNSGTLTELEYSLGSGHTKVVIFDEVKNQVSSLTNLVPASFQRVPFMRFENKAELLDAALIVAWRVSSELQCDLQNRNPAIKEKKNANKGVNELIVPAIDEALLSLGNNVRNRIYSQIECNFGIKKQDIPDKLDSFKQALDSIFGAGSEVIELQIVENLSKKVGASCGPFKPVHSALREYLDSIKEEQVVQANGKKP